MLRLRLATATIAIFGVMALPAHAKVGAFTATCPTNVNLQYDGHGHLRINGAHTELKQVGAGSYDAKHGDVTVSILVDGNSVSVVYTGKHGANGVRQVAMASAGGASTGGAAAQGGMPSKDEQACLAAVSNTTSNGDVDVLRTETSEANNTVIVGVGPQRARWKCLVKNGKVAGVQSLTN
jgi:hypothetical protein